MNYTEKFRQLARLYATTDIEFPHLKAVTLAQWMLESGRGDSWLATYHSNFGGMMWRDEMRGWPIEMKIGFIEYTSPSDNIKTNYVSCGSLATWIRCYWKFIDRAPYKGWREYAKHSAENYIGYLKQCGYAADPDYVDKVLALLPEASELLYSIKDDTHSEGERMPEIDIVKNSPNKSTRTGTISKILLHNTAGSFDGSVSWLCNPNARASAHLVISRTGKTAQLVKFGETAWHAGNGRVNHTSIGIEIEATNSQRGMTEAQEQKVIDWCKGLMRTYGIKAQDIIIHRMVSSTDCPVLIWPTDADFFAWRKKHLESTPKPEPKPEPIPHPNEPEVTWFELHPFKDGIGCVGYNGSEPKVTYHGKSSIALVDFLKRWGDHNIHIAPDSKPWPGSTR